MTIICSWCRREGQSGVVGEKPPLDDRRETHGICVTHRSAVQARWNEMVRAALSGQRPRVEAGAGRLPFSANQMWDGIRNLRRKAGF